MAKGLSDVASVATGMAGEARQQQQEADRAAEQLAAEKEVTRIRQLEAIDKERLRQQTEDAKLQAGNAVVRYELDSDLVLRQWDEKLARGEVDAGQYQDKVAADLRKLGQNIASEVPELGRQQFEVGVRGAGAKNVMKVRDRVEKHVEGQRLGQLELGRENLLRLAVTDLPQALGMAKGMYGEAGPFAGIKGPEAAAKAGQAFKEQATRAHFTARVGQAQGSYQQLGALRKEIAANGDLDPMQQSAMLSSIDSRQQILENRATAGRERAERQAQAALTGLQTLADGGFPVSAAYASEVMAKLKGTGHEAAAREILSGVAETAGFGSKPVAEQDRIVQEMIADAAGTGVDPAQSKRLNKLIGIRDASARDFATNAWRAAADRGQIDAIPPLDSSSIGGLVQSLGDRLQLIDTVDQAAGRPVSPLQPEEVAGLSRMLGALAAPERAELLGEVHKTIGPQRMMALSAQLMKDDPTAAVVAAATANSIKTDAGESVGALILKGEEAIKGKRVKIDDMAGFGIQSEMREALGDAIASPAAADAAVSAAMKVWAAKAADGDSISYREALQAVTGKIVEHAGRKTLAPTGWTADEFERAIEALDAPTLAAATGNQPLFVAGQPVDAESLAKQLDKLALKQGSNDRYALQLGQNLVTDEARRPVYIRLDKPGPAPGFFERIFGAQ